MFSRWLKVNNLFEMSFFSFRDDSCGRPLVHARHGQGPPDVSAQVPVVAARAALLRPHPGLRRVQEVHPSLPAARKLGRERNLLLIRCFRVCSRVNCQLTNLFIF